MELTALRAQSRRLTHTNVTNYPDIDLDSDINVANGEIQLMILESEGTKNTGGDFKVLDFESSDGLDPQDLGYNGEFPFPSITMKLEEVYLDYGDGHVKAEIVDKSEIGSEMFEDTGVYSETSPKVFVYRDSFFPRPMLTGLTVADGIKLLIQRRQKTIVTALDEDPDVAANEILEPEFEPNFHSLIPLKVAQDFFLVNPDKYNPRIDKKVNELESQLISFYADRTPSETRFKAVKEQY